jgi:hypothetical protein
MPVEELLVFGEEAALLKVLEVAHGDDLID